MYFKEKASIIFPSAVWTGGSSIHASIAKEGVLPVGSHEPRKFLAVVKHANIIGQIARTIIKNCPSLEWLMSMEDFQSLLMVDLHRMLQGQGAITTDKSLTNPKTGNVFHRVALLEAEGIVGGIRVWVHLLTNEACLLGWRFRLERQDTETITIREKASNLAKSLEQEFDLIEQYVAKEPTIALELLDALPTF